MQGRERDKDAGIFRTVISRGKQADSRTSDYTDFVEFNLCGVPANGEVLLEAFQVI
jgi:hypothetical protein